MDQYLTDGTRSIPLAILLDREFRELGRWGPRPKELQTFVRAHLDRDMSKEAIHLEVRKWYVGDRGNAMLREIARTMRRLGGRTVGRSRFAVR